MKKLLVVALLLLPAIAWGASPFVIPNVTIQGGTASLATVNISGALTAAAPWYFGDPNAQAYVIAPTLNQNGITNEVIGSVVVIGTGSTATGNGWPMQNYTPNAAYCNQTFENCSHIVGFGFSPLVAVTQADHLVAIGVHPLDAVTDQTGSHNVGVGIDPMRYMTSGQFNTAIGEHALTLDGGVATTASFNTAVGYGTLEYAPSINNTAIGWDSLAGLSTAPVTGINNVGIGYQPCQFVTSGQSNVCIGSTAGRFLGVGSYDVLLGNAAGLNITSSSSVFIGRASGLSSSGAPLTGNNNTAVGDTSFENIQGAAARNVAVGAQAGIAQTTASNNTFVGALTADSVTSGGNNTVIGESAATSVTTGAANTVIGTLAAPVLTGSNNTIIGTQVAPTNATSGSFNILIGNNNGVDCPAVGCSNYINIGGVFIGRYGDTAAPGVNPCGTSPSVDANATDRDGTITAGSGTVTSCELNFHTAYASWVHCTVTSQSAIQIGYTYGLSSLTITGSSLAGDKFDYSCKGY